jgi:hypothetical protein
LTTSINWPALILEALEDIKANLPLPPAPPLSDADVTAMFAAVEANLPAIAAEFKSRPGVITATGRILDALNNSGETWAGNVKAILDAMPGGIASAEKYLPTILGMIAAFSPAPQNPDITGSHGR